MKDILIWVVAILLAILIWPVVIIAGTFLLKIGLTIGLIVVLAYYIKRGIDG